MVGILLRIPSRFMHKRERIERRMGKKGPKAGKRHRKAVSRGVWLTYLAVTNG